MCMCVHTCNTHMYVYRNGEPYVEKPKGSFLRLLACMVCMCVYMHTYTTYTTAIVSTAFSLLHTRCPTRIHIHACVYIDTYHTCVCIQRFIPYIAEIALTTLFTSPHKVPYSYTYTHACVCIHRYIPYIAAIAFTTLFASSHKAPHSSSLMSSGTAPTTSTSG